MFFRDTLCWCSLEILGQNGKRHRQMRVRAPAGPATQKHTTPRLPWPGLVWRLTWRLILASHLTPKALPISIFCPICHSEMSRQRGCTLPDNKIKDPVDRQTHQHELENENENTESNFAQGGPAWRPARSIPIPTFRMHLPYIHIVCMLSPRGATTMNQLSRCARAGSIGVMFAPGPARYGSRTQIRNEFEL